MSIQAVYRQHLHLFGPISHHILYPTVHSRRSPHAPHNLFAHQPAEVHSFCRTYVYSIVITMSLYTNSVHNHSFFGLTCMALVANLSPRCCESIHTWFCGCIHQMGHDNSLNTVGSDATCCHGKNHFIVTT